MVAFIVLAAVLIQVPDLSGVPPRTWMLKRIVVRGHAADDVAFRAVHSVAVDRYGRAYVAETNEGYITVLSVDGDTVRTIGRAGEGPGEFRGIENVAFSSDTLVAADWRLARATWLDTRGRVYRSSNLVFQTGARFRLAAVMAGGALAVLPLVTVNALNDGVPGYPLLRVDADGSVRDTLAWLRYEQRGAGRGVSIGDSRFGFPEPFAGKGLVARASNRPGVVVVDALIPDSRRRTTFALFRLDGSARIIGSRRYGFVPEPMNEVAVAEAVFPVAARIRSSPRPPPPDLELHLARGIWKPEYLPPVTDVTLTDAGEVWLRRERTSPHQTRWDVIGPDGALFARVTGPPGTLRLFEGNGFLWGIEVDELGVEQIVRYEIVR
jgi:hypothetical protein